MKNPVQQFVYIVALLALGGCASVAPPPDGCVGLVGTPPAGLVESSDDALLASALGAPTKGALCKGKVFIAERDVPVFRVWDAAKSYTLYGRWWSFAQPQGPRDQYQIDNDICPEWSALNKMSSCTIKSGSKIVVGPGQSAQCAASLLPPSPINQVYIPNDSKNNVLFVENCSTGSDWPAPGK